jgi:hypothetical protein
VATAPSASLLFIRLFYRGLLQIILAVDRDTAGDHLATELARRLGRQKCKLTRWPVNWLDHTYIDTNKALQYMSDFEKVLPDTPPATTLQCVGNLAARKAHATLAYHYTLVLAQRMSHSSEVHRIRQGIGAIELLELARRSA